MYATFADWMRRPGGRSVESGIAAIGSAAPLLTKGVTEARAARYARLFDEYRQARAQGQTHKIWIASPDERTRASHRAAHGQIQPIGSAFSLGADRLFLPCDPDASLAETANCRCTVRFIRLRATLDPGAPALLDVTDGLGARPGDQLAQVRLPPPRGPARRGDNGGPPLEPPPTLAQIFPGLANSPLGAMLAPADSFLDLSGPAAAAVEALYTAARAQLIADIQEIYPDYTYPSLGSPLTTEGRAQELNDLRMIRAAALYTERGSPDALQVETLRFLQKSVDVAYAEGVRRYNDGELYPRLSRNEAIGNFIDRQVRRNLQIHFNAYRLNWGGGRDITINNRDYDRSASDVTYRIPDARVGRVSFDWTLTRKLRVSPQIRGFFSADSMPDAIIIVRPRQIGPDYTYLITR